MTHTHRDFFDALIRALDLSIRPAGRRALACVSIFESSQGNEKWNNPLAVTQPWPNAEPYNSFGPNLSLHVWRYATLADGVHATAKILAQPHWDDVRHALKVEMARNPILDAFTRAYTWVDWQTASFPGFRHAPFNQVDQLLARLDHPLYGPQD